MTSGQEPDAQPAETGREERVLVAAPTGRDAAVLTELLEGEGIRADVCATLEELCRELGRGAGAGILAEEALTAPAQRMLSRTLARQPEWSDFPLIIMTSTSGRDPRWHLAETNGSAHPILLERPVRKAILLSSVQAALLARKRQYQVRQELRRRRRAERELRESEEQRRVALTAGRMGTWTWDLKTDTVVGDDVHCRLWGVDKSDSQIPLDKFLSRLHPEDASRFFTRGQVTASTEPLDAEFRIQRSGGELRWLKASAMLLLDEAGIAHRLIGVNFDITEQKQYEQRLLDADRHKDDFIAMLAHELRNPLAPIRNATQVFDLVDLGDEILVEMRDIIKRQVSHMARLLDDLLDVSRIARGKVKLKRERVDLCELTRTTAEDLRGTFVEQGLELSLQGPEGPLMMDADPTRISQCIGNLLHNARKFTQQGGAVRVELSCDDDHATITVTDNGLGMEDEFIKHLFEPFRQADRSLDRSPGGLGLGLAMVRGLVELHGGAVYARSDGEGKGSEFVIHLPLEAPR